MLSADPEAAGAERRPLAIPLAVGLDARRGRDCTGAIAGSAFSTLSDRTDWQIGAEVSVVTGVSRARPERSRGVQPWGGPPIPRRAALRTENREPGAENWPLMRFSIAGWHVWGVASPRNAG